MDTSRGIVRALAIAAVITVAVLPCSATEKNNKDSQSIWTENEQGPGPGRGGPGPRRLDLTKEEIGRILDSVKQRDPKAAEELTKLREKNPEKFMDELRKHARDEFGKVIKERIEKWREQRQADFIEWLQKTLPAEAEELAKLKESNPDLYSKKYDLTWRKYGRIFEERGRNPELANVLVEDLKLKKREDELVGKIKASTNQKEKEKLDAELEQVAGNRYDLILRRKQIAYEWLLKRLDELQNRIRESRAEMLKFQDPEVKAENVKQRKKDLLEKKEGFRWD
jgi:hypothetical protein